MKVIPLLFVFAHLICTSTHLYGYKLVGLIAVRNENEILEQALKALARLTDAIVILDDASEDTTLETIHKLRTECNIERILTKERWQRDENGDRNKLLMAGRNIGGTHFICIDADEIVSSNCLENNYLRNEIFSLQPGDSITMKWVQLWRSVYYYRNDDSAWSNSYKEIIFCDESTTDYTGDFIHVKPIPPLSGIKKRLDDSHCLLHFQFVNRHNLLVKQAWYRCLERIRTPHKNVHEINGRYRTSTQEVNVGLSPVPSNWLSGYDFFDPSVYDIQETWRTAQINQWFKAYGKEYFKELEIWNIDWESYIKKPVQYIRGESFRSCANHILDDATTFNPSDVKKGDIIFVQTNHLPTFYKYQQQIQADYILITHKSDWPLQGPCRDMINDPRLIAWFGANPYFKHPKLMPIPFGVSPDISNEEYETYLTTIKKRGAPKINLAYMNFAVNDYDGRCDRPFVWNYFKDYLFCLDMCYQRYEKPLCTPEEYLKQTAESEFIISPQGSGLDCYRTYEALLAGSYAIVKSSDLDDLFIDLPVLIVKNWQEITSYKLREMKEKFANKPYNFQKLYEPYWKNKIKKMQALWRTKSAVTYEISTGRLGDRLVTYCKAKQLALKHGMTLLHKPFTYSKELGIDEKELIFEESDTQNFDHVSYVSDLNDPTIDGTANTLYVLTKKHWQDPLTDQSGAYHVTADESLKKALQETIDPTGLVTPYYKIPGYITVAMHVRTGANYQADINLLKSHNYLYDTQTKNSVPVKEDQEVVLKFPSLIFYYEQMVKLLQIFNGKKIYLTIYTDFPNPEAMARLFTQQLNNPNLVCVAKNNRQDSAVIQDLYEMAHADILLRPRSGISVVAQLIGEHMLVMWPKKGHWAQHEFLIDDVGIYVKK